MQLWPATESHLYCCLVITVMVAAVVIVVATVAFTRSMSSSYCLNLCENGAYSKINNLTLRCFSSTNDCHRKNVLYFVTTYYWLLIFCCDFFFFPAVVAADAPSNHFILALMSGKQIDLNPSICVNARSNECYVTDAYWTKIKMDSWATVKMGTANVRGIENSEIKMAKKAICCCSLCSQYL